MNKYSQENFCGTLENCEKQESLTQQIFPHCITLYMYSVKIICGGVYTGIHQFKSTIAKSVGKKLVRHDPIPPVATSIASEAHLLCFDEFQVPDPILYFWLYIVIPYIIMILYVVLLIPYIVIDAKYRKYYIK